MDLRKLLESAFYAASRIQKKSRLSGVRRSSLAQGAVVEGGSQVVDSQIGRHSFCGYDCVVLSANIGSFCSIADQVYIGGSQHPMHFVSTSPVFLSHRDSVKAKFSRHEFRSMPTTNVGNDVWIGFAARVRAGVKIGDGAVIGMGSVVTRDVPPYAVVAGCPARVVSYRFSAEIISALQKSEWWNYDDDDLRRAAVNFGNPVVFLRERGLL